MCNQHGPSSLWQEIPEDRPLSPALVHPTPQVFINPLRVPVSDVPSWTLPHPCAPKTSLVHDQRGPYAESAGHVLLSWDSLGKEPPSLRSSSPWAPRRQPRLPSSSAGPAQRPSTPSNIPAWSSAIFCTHFPWAVPSSPTASDTHNRVMTSKCKLLRELCSVLCNALYGKRI